MSQTEQVRNRDVISLDDDAVSPARILIVVPAYNEEASLAATMEEIRRYCPWADAVIVNDGSRDATAAIAAAAGYPMLSLPFNLGIGGAVQTGFQYAVQEGYDVVVQVDADGQHPPEGVAALLEPIISGGCDVCVGSRFLAPNGYRQSFWRRLGIRVLARLIGRLTGQRISDPTSGFRAFGRAAVAVLAEDYPYDYPEPEALVMLDRHGFRIAEIPVAMRHRQNGSSSIGLSVAIKYMSKVLLAIGVSTVRRKVKQPAPRS